MPTELGFILGQSMVVAGKASYSSIFLIALLGKTLGSIITYFIGKFFADRIKKIRKETSRAKAAQETFARWMKKYGDLAVFISRLVGYVRPWSSYFAGIGEIKFLPFIFYNVLGSAANIALSMLTLGLIVELWRKYGFLRPYIAVILILAFFAFWLWLAFYAKYKKARKNNRTS